MSNSNRISVLVPPTGSAFDIDLVKIHLGIDFDDDDLLIAALIDAAADMIEGQGINLLTRTGRLTMDRLPWEGFYIPMLGVQEIQQVSYLDLSSTWQVMDPSLYIADVARRRTTITRNYTAIWPIPLPVAGCVRVDFTYGFGEQADIPAGIKSAANLLISNWYLNREAAVGLLRSATPAELPFGVSALLARHAGIPFA